MTSALATTCTTTNSWAAAAEIIGMTWAAAACYVAWRWTGGKHWGEDRDKGD